MIRAIIIDDESRARQLLHRMVEQHLGGRVKVVAEADSIDGGVQVIQQYKPDLVFLDIQMPEGTGFDLLERLDVLDFEIVFVTAFDEYAIRAIRFSAFGYLLKPIKPLDLQDVISRLEDHLQERKDDMGKRVKVLIENYGDDRTLKKLIISHMHGFDVSLVEDIVRLEGDGNYTHFIITEGRKVTTSRTLGEYEDLLYGLGFYRIHQSTIVNLRHVTRYIKGTGGQVEMSDGESFNVSRYRKAGFLRYFLE